MACKEDHHLIAASDALREGLHRPVHAAVVEIEVQLHLKASSREFTRHGSGVIASFLKFVDMLVGIVANHQRNALGLHRGA